MRQEDEEYKTKCFYSKLVKLKFHSPVSQGKLGRDFQISDKEVWKSIYFNKIKNVKDKSLAEFNYKLLNNLLSNNLLISKWNKGVNNKCKICKTEIEDAQHLIFDCVNVNHVWHNASQCLNFTID